MNKYISMSHFHLLFGRRPLFVTFALLTVITLLLGYSDKDVILYGGCDDSVSPYLVTKYDDNRRTTYCDSGDTYTGMIKTAYFTLSDKLWLTYAGYPSKAVEAIYLERENGDKWMLKGLVDAKELWVTRSISSPNQWLGEKVRLVALDQMEGSWLGIKVNISAFNYFNFLQVYVLLFCIYIFFVSVYILAIKINEKNSLYYFFILLGSCAYISFFSYYFSILLGQIFSLLTLLVLSLNLICQTYIVPRKTIMTLELLFPMFITSMLLLFYMGYPDFNYSQESGANLWSNLPIDNWLPKFFADQVISGTVQSPMIGDWLSSDRGPLQTGMILLFSPLLRMYSDNFYQVFGLFLQLLVILPLYFFTKSLDYKKYLFLFLILLCFTFSPLMFFNATFIWPKLISAACVICVYLYFYKIKDGMKRENKYEAAFIIASLTVFSILFHGGSFFSIAMMPLAFLFTSNWFLRRVSFKSSLLFIGTAIFTCMFLYLPWSSYQHYIDPPGDRLLKWHFAGVTNVTDQSFAEAFSAAYASMSFSEIINNKLQNLVYTYNPKSSFYAFMFEASKSNFSEFVKQFMDLTFFKFFAAMTFFSPFFLFLWLFKKPHKDLSFLIWCSGLSLVFWCVAMFIPNSTTIHQGSYFLWLSWYAIIMITVLNFKETVFILISSSVIVLNLMMFFSDLFTFNMMGLFLFILIFIVTIQSLHNLPKGEKLSLS